jgi:2',3'-cyclic-nucleotide 2'-phosphodiesterase (5'-nucleotidase family)
MSTRLVATLAGTLALAVLAGCAGPGRTPLRILYTGSLNGNLDGCTCRYVPRAGLVKVAAWLRSSPGRRDALLVDAGDLLAADPDQQLAYEMVEAFRELGYDAVAVGDQDIRGGIEPLHAFAQRIPLLADNVAFADDPVLEGTFPPGELVIRRAGWTVGVFSLLDPGALGPNDDGEASPVAVASPEAAARETVDRFTRRRVDLTVLLYHGRRSAAEDLSRAVPGIDVLIFAHEQELVAPVHVGRTIVASPGEEGNRVGILEIAKRDGLVAIAGSGFHELHYLGDPDDPGVRARIVRYLRTFQPLTVMPP